MRIRFLSSLTVAAAMAVSLSAHAAPPPPASFSNFDLTLTLDGGEVDWIIPYGQAPSAELFDGLIPDGAEWSDPETDLANSLLSGPGEFQFFDDGDFEMSLNGGSFLGFTGDIPMISGSATDPALLPGTYDLRASLGHNAQLTISATPEPSSMLLLGTGILGMAAAMRRRLTA